MKNATQANLERLAAQFGQAIIRRTREEKASDIENIVTKSLGVLQEDGVYACFLYLLAKEKDKGTVVVEEMLNLLDGLGFGWRKPIRNGQIDTTAEAVLRYISETVMVDLQRLLLAKETLEQMLIYARYGAKARS